jgi:hypothetical protein
MWRAMNMGYRHELLDFYAPTKALFNLQVPVIEELETNFRRRRRKFSHGRGD